MPVVARKSSPPEEDNSADQNQSPETVLPWRDSPKDIANCFWLVIYKYDPPPNEHFQFGMLCFALISFLSFILYM